MMGCIELGWRSRNFSAWWWLEPWHNLWLSTSWECHHPNWLILYNITYIYIYFFLGSYLLGEKKGVPDFEIRFFTISGGQLARSSCGRAGLLFAGWFIWVRLTSKIDGHLYK
jgi:hypothetical protein